MKCTFCNEEFEYKKDKSMRFCPICKNPVYVKDDKLENIGDVLTAISDNFGNEKLKDKKFVLQCIEIFLPRAKREYNFVNIAFSSGSISLLFQSKKMDKEAQDVIVNNVKESLQEEYGISSVWVDTIVYSFAKAIGLSVECSSSSLLLAKAQSGDATAQYNLAIKYKKSDNEKDFLYWIEKSADNGNIDARIKLCEEQFNIAKSDKEQKYLLISIFNMINKENIDAISFLAGHINEIPKYKEKVIDLVNENIDVLNCDYTSEQLVRFSIFYEYLKDYVNVASCIKKAYEINPIESWKRYIEILDNKNIEIYERGNDNYRIAVKNRILRDVRNLGSIDAIKELAKHLEKEAKNAKEFQIAMTEYSVIAAQGDLDAQLNLGRMNEYNRFDIINIDEAVSWYELAAENGSKEALDKINLESSSCIRKNLEIINNDGEEIKIKLLGKFRHKNLFYVILEDPDNGQPIPFEYSSNNNGVDYELEPLSGIKEKRILALYKLKK